MNGLITEIQHFCVHDGPGVRTTVFLKGCPLSCPWCHNPEGRKPYREICCMADRCALCGACAHLCPCHTIDGSRHRFDSSACIGCLRCAALCPSGALAVYGSEVSAADVVAKVERDRPFYGRRGGMTLSGGEPMAQPAFALEILSLARARGLSTCVQTSGAFAPEYARALATGCDHILFDIKDTDPARHLRNTGAALEPILDNLLALDRLGARVTVKCILLAGVNDTPEHLESLTALRRRLRSAEGMAVFSWHAFGRAKRETLGLPPDDGRDCAVNPGTLKCWQRAIDHAAQD